MSVIKSRSVRNTAPAATTEDEYAGLYLNPGVFVGTDADGKPKFSRFNRGVYIGDLKERPIYESMDPEFAAELEVINARISRIKAKSLTLEEGEWVVVNIPTVIYRRMESAEVAPTPKADLKAIDDELFG